jgi:tripartite-type tricarboxylate transporter receptor subunit TctC
LPRIYRGIAAAALVASLFITPAAAEDFYKGKTLSLVVGYAVGGGYDVYARLLARHLQRHIPGSPTIIVQNMPGAGSLTALKHQEAIAPKDGTVATLFDFVQIINAKLDPERTNFDVRTVSWIGSMSED